MGGGSAGSGRVGLTSSACVLVRGGADEATWEVLPARVVAERAGWCAALTREMTTGLLKEHWSPCDHAIPGRKLPGKRAQTLDLAYHARHASVRHSYRTGGSAEASRRPSSRYAASTVSTACGGTDSRSPAGRRARPGIYR
jgi:hypothetical protein